ncbi:MAG: 16S rRNA (guanine(966)-N(2))-methyltransferase RsmD [Prevotella sp.]|nr:16S rRNA (guanine(966)-N(2))-methyltransferase RsmD [Prevotella sp.]
MRIITGKYKGRHFDIPRSFKARPTTDFAKENIFNVLTGYIDFEDATALDLFSGTGSITLELLSRGCKQVVSVEADRDHYRFICECLKKLSPSPALPIRGDVFRFVKSCRQQFDFIFADPPYALQELPKIPDLIFEKNLLKEDGVFVFEHGKNNDFSKHPHFAEHRQYGSVNFSIFKATAKPAESDSPTVAGEMSDALNP